MSIVLLLGAVQGSVVAIVLARRRTNRQANLLLSGLVLILTLKLIPYVIGYAGFYAVYPWLDLAPFDLTLGVGPLLFLYLSRLTTASMPSRWKLHLLPLLAQISIYTVMFLQPMSFKNWFEGQIGPVFNRTENTLEVVSMIAYVWMTMAVYRNFEKRLKNRGGDPSTNRIRVIGTGLGVIGGTLLTFVGAKLWGLLIHPLSYFQMFPIYLLLTVVVYAFGFIALQIADLTIPQSAPTKEINWAEVAAAYTSQLAAADFWRDPQLSIATAAQALNTPEGRLSRAINSGLGISFSEWVNEYRIEQVASRLRVQPDSQSILEIAFECGFNSKATFNRWFRHIEGCTPTEFRSRCLQAEVPAPISHPAPQQ